MELPAIITLLINDLLSPLALQVLATQTKEFWELWRRFAAVAKTRLADMASRGVVW